VADIDVFLLQELEYLVTVLVVANGRDEGYPQPKARTSHGLYESLTARSKRQVFDLNRRSSLRQLAGEAEDDVHDRGADNYDIRWWLPLHNQADPHFT
jgi:hypothetical protein